MLYIITEDSNSAREFWDKAASVYRGAGAYTMVPLLKEKEAAYVGQILWINNGNICPISQKILNQMTAIEQGCMNCAAVIFDLFETLITEWGHKK